MLKSFPIGGMKGDYWRYFMLYKVGGVYIDIDMLPIKPIYEWPDYPWEGIDTLIAPEHIYPDQGIYVWNKFCMWTMISAPGNPLFMSVCDEIKGNWRNNGKQVG